MINGILWVLGCQLVGEVLVRGLGLSIPGPVVGMVLLFGVLSWRRPGPESGTLRFSDGLLRHLQLFFVPVTVGIMVHVGELGEQWLPVTGGLVLSWAAGLVTVAALGAWLQRRRGVRAGGHD
ncbi:CidA/LrgA family protein [Janibacter anophelis]|uniref:CidA/LrgA family protein n=1 Tax=Janibacter anophelis TaxID=319054 RepID=UPI003F7DEAB5